MVLSCWKLPSGLTAAGPGEEGHVVPVVVEIHPPGLGDTIHAALTLELFHVTASDAAPLQLSLCRCPMSTEPLPLS